LKPWSQAPRAPPIFTQAMQIASNSREPSIPPMSSRSDQPKSARTSANCAFGRLVISSDQHGWLALAEPWLDEIGVADRVERLDHFGVGQRALDALTERVLARDRELWREAVGEIERVHGVDDDLAAEVVRAGVGDHLLRGTAEDG
jgi:hypothetical protein